MWSGIEEVKRDLKIASGNISEEFFGSRQEDQDTVFDRLRILHVRLARLIQDFDGINADLEREWLDVSNLKELPEEEWREERAEDFLERVKAIQIEASIFK